MTCLDCSYASCSLINPQPPVQITSASSLVVHIEHITCSCITSPSWEFLTLSRVNKKGRGRREVQYFRHIMWITLLSLRGGWVDHSTYGHPPVCQCVGKTEETHKLTFNYRYLLQFITSMPVTWTFLYYLFVFSCFPPKLYLVDSKHLATSINKATNFQSASYILILVQPFSVTIPPLFSGRKNNTKIYVSDQLFHNSQFATYILNLRVYWKR